MRKLREFDPEEATYLAIKGAKGKRIEFRLTHVRPVALTGKELGNNTLYRNTEPLYHEVGLDTKGWAQILLASFRDLRRYGKTDVRPESGLEGAGI